MPELLRHFTARNCCRPCAFESTHEPVVTTANDCRGSGRAAYSPNVGGWLHRGLNAQSRIVYPAIFPKGERRVQLSGEAIFNVAHNSECPFIVETFACDVEVLGTHFDVIANQAENRFSTALFSGRGAVRIKKTENPSFCSPTISSIFEMEGFKSKNLKIKTIICGWMVLFQCTECRLSS